MTRLCPVTTVRAIAAGRPGAAELFRSRGINVCCGDNVALSDVALKAGLLPDRLIAHLQALPNAAGRDAPEATPALIDPILTRYHETHRAELKWPIPLAPKVESLRGDHENAPLDPTEALIPLHNELEAHMAREEAELIPPMRQGDHAMIVHPIAPMRHEHDETTKLRAGVEHRTHGQALPGNARGSWTLPYAGLHKVSKSLVADMHLEHTAPFARFEPAEA